MRNQWIKSTVYFIGGVAFGCLITQGVASTALNKAEAIREQYRDCIVIGSQATLADMQ